MLMSGVDKWLVEVRHRSPAGLEVRHFYLVDGVAGSEQACSVAGQRAAVACGRSRRSIAEADYRWGTVQRILREPLGGITLSAPFPPVERRPLAGPGLSAVREV
jgi:hypothetical protein